MEDALRQNIEESLASYMHSNAIFMAERLYAESSSFANLRLLAHCHVTAGDPGTAYRLLQHEYSHVSAEQLQGLSPSSPEWQCRFLYGVTAAMTKCYLEAESILTDLTPATPAVKHWLGVCGRELQRRWAGDNYFKAVQGNTSLFASYEAAVKHYGRFPTSPYDSPKPVGVAEVGVVHQDPSTAPSPSASAKPSAPKRFASLIGRKTPPPDETPSQSGAGTIANHTTVYQLLQKFAQVARLLYDYKCPEALTQIQAIPAKQRRSGWVLVAQALAYFHNGNHQEAWQVFEQLREKEPWRLNDPALIHASTALWHLKRDVELGTLAQTLVQANPHSAITMCVVGNCYSLAREHKAAIKILTRASQADKTLAVAHALRGYEYMGLDERTDAQMCFDNALRHDPRLYIGYAGMGELQLRQDKVQKAQKYFQMAIDINPLPQIQNRLGFTYMGQGAPPESIRTAIDIFERILRKHPSHYGAKIHHATALTMLGDFPRALAELQELKDHHPTEAIVRIKMGECLKRLGRRLEAVQVFHEALDLDPRRQNQIRGQLEELAAPPKPSE